MKQIRLGDITVDVELKNIRHIHLGVYPPTGRVRIAAPLHMNTDTIRVYLVSRLQWIKKQQVKFIAQEREAPREYLHKEGHYFLGRRYLLQVEEHNVPARVKLKHQVIELYIRAGATPQKKQEALEAWYRSELNKLAAPLITRWQKKMGVTVNECRIKKMKTKWGTCNAAAGRIWLNLELAKKPPHCIEYIIVHEMVHLLERNHTDRFVACMNRFLPGWKHLKTELNRLPVSHREWKY